MKPRIFPGPSGFPYSIRLIRIRDLTFLLAAVLTMAGQACSQMTLKKASDPLGQDVSGDQQVVVAGREASKPLVVQVTNSKGKPLAGVKVLFEVAGGKAARLDSARSQTDVQGYARCRPTSKAGPQPVYVNAWLAAAPEQKVTFTLHSFLPHWWLFALLGSLGGVALFLFGLRFSSRGLQKAAGVKLKQMLWSLTDNSLMGMGVGALVTVIIQSSTATTVMLVSLTNAGLIGLRQVLGVILGADIGTTVTVQLIAFKLSDYSLILVALGFLLMTIAGKRPWRYYPQIMFGAGLIFFGLKLTSEAIAPLKVLPWFTQIFLHLDGRPLLGILIGTAFTLLVHSSAATIGILLTLAFQGLIPLPSAIPVIIGANIGTCGSALIAAWGQTKEAVLVAWGHAIFKVGAGLLAFILINPFTAVVVRMGGEPARQIANAHTLFNLAAALIFLPFLVPYEKLLRRLVPDQLDRQKAFGPKYLDERVLETPSLAIGQVSQEILRMAHIVKEMLARSMEALEKNDTQLQQQLVADDDKVDLLEEAITPYVAKIAQQELSGEQSDRGIKLLYVVNDLEHIGDVISKNIMSHVQKKIDGQLAFSQEGLSELREIHRQTMTTLDIAIGAFAANDPGLARQALERKDTVYAMEREFYKKHLDRLQKGLKESQETSTIHLDLLSDFERINFNASQMGASILPKE
jgi:phosphate:Na+ symporter